MFQYFFVWNKLMFQRTLLYKYLIVLNTSNWKHSKFWSKLRKILSGKFPECASYSSWRIYWMDRAILQFSALYFCKICMRLKWLSLKIQSNVKSVTSIVLEEVGGPWGSRMKLGFKVFTYVGVDVFRCCMLSLLLGNNNIDSSPKKVWLNTCCTCRMPACQCTCKGCWLIQRVGSEKNLLQKRVFVLSILLLCCLSFCWGLATIFLDLFQAHEQAQAAQKFGSRCNTEVLLPVHANVGFQSPNMKYLDRTQIVSLSLLCWKDISTMG